MYSDRENELYGAGRTATARRIHDTLLKTHVLQNGDYNYGEDKSAAGNWETSAALDFPRALRTKIPQEDKEPEPVAIQHLDSHFRLGNDSDTHIPRNTYMLSVTRGDFDEKETFKPVLSKENRTVNWPDMAPHYSVNRSMGSTTYRGTFMSKALESEAPMYRRINSCKVSLPIQLQSNTKNEVSVSLGSDPSNYLTETDRAYNRPVDPDGGQLDAHLDIANRMQEAAAASQRMRDLSTNSNVFRKGDYNDNGRERASSIFSLDFCKKSFAPMTNPLSSKKKTGYNRPADGGTGNASDEDEDDDDIHRAGCRRLNRSQFCTKVPAVITHHLRTFVPEKFQIAEAGRNDHISAHFQFGVDDNSGLTIYGKDFAMADKIPRDNVFLHPAPKDSAVLERDEGRSTGNTTNRTEFCPKVYEMGISANAHIKKSAMDNMIHRVGKNVILTRDQDDEQYDRQVSLSKASYVQPPKEFRAMTPRKATSAKYNYLETEVALPFQVPKFKLTDNQYNFSGCMMDAETSMFRRKEKDEQTRSRLDHGRGTHFVLGYDRPEYSSEQVHNFQGKTREAVEMRAAGKKETKPSARFNHFYHNANLADMSVPRPYAPSIGESLVARRLAVTRAMPSLPTHKATIMKNDFQPICDRRYTTAQLMVLEQNARLEEKPMAVSHFFHTDTPSNNNFHSTTMVDFIRPANVV